MTVTVDGDEDTVLGMLPALLFGITHSSQEHQGIGAIIDPHSQTGEKAREQTQR